jgi:hypothetical protein
MINDDVLDRLIGLLWCLDARALSTRLTVADTASRTLAAAGLTWGDVLPAWRAGAEALAQRLAAKYSPETLAWAAGPDWERFDTEPGELRVLRYHDPTGGLVVEVRECRSSCPDYDICSRLRPGLGSGDGRLPPTSRWRTLGPICKEDDPFFCGGYSCFPDKISAQLAVYWEVEARVDEAFDAPGPTPEELEEMRKQASEAGT